MPLHPFVDPVHAAFLLAIVFLSGLIVSAALGAYRAWKIQRGATLSVHGTRDADYRHCRYCRWGEALLVAESIRFEHLERVTTRCYVCNSCSLPHWFVQRHPTGHLAES